MRGALFCAVAVDAMYDSGSHVVLLAVGRKRKGESEGESELIASHKKR